MIITISGLHGTGKSSVGKKIAESLGIRYYSTGDAFRDLAEEKGMTLEDFSLYVEEHPEIDNELDDRVVEMGRKGNIIVDAQLSAYLLDDVADFKILLTCPLKVRVERMMTRDESDYDEKLKETLMRENSELERFKEMYNIDLSDADKAEKLYDFVLSTEFTTVEEALEKVLEAIKKL